MLALLEYVSRHIPIDIYQYIPVCCIHIPIPRIPIDIYQYIPVHIYIYLDIYQYIPVDIYIYHIYL